MMTDVEHRQRLIDANNLSALHLLGKRPCNASCARSKIENNFAALERQRLDELLGQVGPDIGQSAAIEIFCMRRIMKATFVIMIVRVLIPMIV